MSELHEQLVNWTNAQPTHEGMYLYKMNREWPWRLLHVKRGDWHFSQNPEWLYGSCGKPVGDHEPGWWLGPIEEPPGMAS